MSETFMTLTDSLHFILPRDQAEGKYVSLAAIADGQSSRRTVPLYLGSSPPSTFPLTVEPESLAAATEQGDTIQTAIVLFNPTTSLVERRIQNLSNHQLNWLSFDTAQVALMPGAIDTVHFHLSSVELSVGVHRDTLLICCQSDGLVFQSRALEVIFRVDQATATEDEAQSAPLTAALSQNYPNPFNSSTVILSASPLPIRVFDLLGQTVAVLRAGAEEMPSGYRFIWNGTDQSGRPVAGGIYFCRQQGEKLTRKMILLK